MLTRKYRPIPHYTNPYQPILLIYIPTYARNLRTNIYQLTPILTNLWYLLIPTSATLAHQPLSIFTNLYQYLPTYIANLYTNKST